MPAFTTKEQEKLSVIKSAIKGEITNELAATKLQLSVRQIKRLKKTVREEGDGAIIHQLKGKQSNHHIDTAVKEKTVDIIKEKYADFKPTFATEKLDENHDIQISYGTTRLWMIEKGLWKPRKQKKGTYRSWRQRKDHYGELQQFDGSYHLWLELRFCDENGEPLEMCLLAAIDDATGEITKAVFAENEGVIAVFTFWKGYVETKGKPPHIYADKFSTYKINHKKAVDNHELLTQFQRAMRQLSVNLIPAHSPQAKGRIERLNETLQDRLVKELRLANISTPRGSKYFSPRSIYPQIQQKICCCSSKRRRCPYTIRKRRKSKSQSYFFHPRYQKDQQ